MPLPGEETAKLGFRYEDLLTASCMLDALKETADAIHLVPLGPEGEGIEFVLYRGSQKEFHQVKRQQSGTTGYWTISKLAKVLKDFQQKLADSFAKCVFVSMQEVHPLRELTENARFCSSYDEFQRNYLSQADRPGGFHNLRNQLGTSEEDAFEFLKRTEFRTIDQDSLKSKVDLQIEALIEGNPDLIRPALIEFAQDNLHQKLAAQDIWEFLKKKGFTQTNWTKDNTTLALQREQNERFLNSLRTEIILGTVISRPEVTDILKIILDTGTKGTTLITGQAGVGKSTVLLEVVENLLSSGIPVLAFRVDRLDAVSRPQDVGFQLGLKASPAVSLARIAGSNTSVLVIDQLDAVSMISGRNPQFLDCISGILDETHDLKMKVVLSCRKFDLDNDSRLKKLAEHKETTVVSVKPLPREVVMEILKKIGINNPKLSDSQLNLLAIPLHLKLLSESLASGSQQEVLSFQTVKDLYDNYWKYKRSYIENMRLRKTISWSEIMGRLSHWMSENQTLAAPKYVVDAWSGDANTLASEHVLIDDAGKYSFFHEGFFDYSFARTFLGQGGKLSKLLDDSEQALFRRSQVRQILILQREADFKSYLADLDLILTNLKMRMHLKELVLKMLKEINDPSPEELEIVLKAMENPGCEKAALSLFIKNIKWFELLVQNGHMASWLQGTETRINRALWVLMCVQDQQPDTVVDLLQPFFNQSEEWNMRLKNVISRGEWSASRKYFELCKSMVEAGKFEPKEEGLRNILIMGVITKLAKANSPWAIEILAAWIDRFSAATAEELRSSESRGSIFDKSLDEEFLHDAAKGSPVQFVEQILPLIKRLVEKTATESSRLPKRDGIWPYRWDRHRLGGDAALLSATVLALSKVARDFPDRFESIFRDYSGTEYDTLQYLFIRALAANPEKFADLAMEYLCEADFRLESGYMGMHDSHYSASTELVRLTSPHCSNEILDVFIDKVMNYYSDYELSKDGMRARGYAQLLFLESVDPARLTPIALKRLNELRRKFPQEQKQKSTLTSGFGSVPSPVPEAATVKMTDDQWRSAIEKYSDDELRHDKGDGLVGGAFQMAHSLGEATKRDPVRFVKLAANLPDNINPTYLDSVLNAIAEVGADPDLLFDLLRRCHALPNKPCGRSICWALRKFPGNDVPDDVLEILQWYALNDPDPETELWRTPASGGTPYYGGSIYDAGINSVRGAAAEAIGALLFKNKALLPKFLATIEQLVKDPLLAVRSCAATALLAVLNHDRDAAVKLFIKLVETDDILLRTRGIEDFLYYALYTHYKELLPILTRMLKSSIPEVAEVAARRVSLLVIDNEESRDLVTQCLQGSQEMRKGVAKTCAHNINVNRFREFSEATLKTLFNDPSAGVRSEASSCFHHLEHDEMQHYRGLAEAFIRSSAFTENHDYLIRALDKTTAVVPDLICSACLAFLDLVDKDAADNSKRAGATGYEVSKLAVRAYAQARDENLRSRCLNLIDRLMDLGVYGVEDKLSSFER